MYLRKGKLACLTIFQEVLVGNQVKLFPYGKKAAVRIRESPNHGAWVRMQGMKQQAVAA